MTNKMTTILCIILAVAIAAIGLSCYLYFDARGQLRDEQDTNTVLLEENTLLKDRLTTGAGTPAATEPAKDEPPTKEPTTQAPTKPPAPPSAATYADLESVLDKLLHAYYDASTRRSGTQLMTAIKPYLTDAAYKKYANTDDGGSSGNMKYESNIQIVTTMYLPVSDKSIQALSVGTLTVVTDTGKSTSTVLFRTDNLLVDGAWKTDAINIVLTDAFAADRLR